MQDSLAAPYEHPPEVKTAPAQKSSRPARDQGFMVSRTYDSLLFIFSPLLALILGASLDISKISDVMMTYRIYDPFKEPQYYEDGMVSIFLGIIIHAHLVAVFFRSHLRKSVFQTYKYRMTLVPALLILGMLTNNSILVFCGLLTTWWDVYHSGAQTLGFGRIYDRIAKVELPEWARKLDAIMNQVIYAGPILAGINFLNHLNDFEDARNAGWDFIAKIPFEAENGGWLPVTTLVVTAVCSVFMVVYIGAQVYLHKKGYKISQQKMMIYIVTAIVSIYTWGFYSFGDSFFIMNVFHAVQYFAIVWAVEKNNLAETFQVKKPNFLVLCLFLGPAFLYGYLQHALPFEWVVAIVNAVALLHFWYDGFIWKTNHLKKEKAI